MNGKSEWTCSRGERIRITRRRVPPFPVPYFRGAGRDEATEFRVGSTMVLYRVHPRLHVYKLSNLVDESVPGPLFMPPSRLVPPPLRYASTESKHRHPLSTSRITLATSTQKHDWEKLRTRRSRRFQASNVRRSTRQRLGAQRNRDDDLRSGVRR